MLVVHQLARVLLDMDALDADLLDAVLVLLVEQDLDLALADQRMVELAESDSPAADRRRNNSCGRSGSSG